MAETPGPPEPIQAQQQENPFSNPFLPDAYIQTKEAGNLKEAVRNAGGEIVGRGFDPGSSKNQQQIRQRYLAGLLPVVTKDLKEHPEHVLLCTAAAVPNAPLATSAWRATVRVGVDPARAYLCAQDKRSVPDVHGNTIEGGRPQVQLVRDSSGSRTPSRFLGGVPAMIEPSHNLSGEVLISLALLVARLGLTAVFLVAGLAKLADLSGSRQAWQDFGVPAVLADLCGALLPVADQWVSERSLDTSFSLSGQFV